MYKVLMLLLALALAPTFTFGAHKHCEKLHAKMSEHNHKKRMKQAAKDGPCGKKNCRHHH